MTRRPAQPRYQVQTRSGTEWGWYAGADNLDRARAIRRDARAAGHATRILDTRTYQVVR